jgi:hypothetical protein
MADYHTFTSARTTDPDPATLSAALRGLDATAGLQVRPDLGPRTYVVKKATSWTAPQITAAQTAIDTAPETTAAMRYTRTSREKDILTTLAMIVRAKNLAAWNAMTIQQKKDATFAEADVWVTIRDFVENNL